MNPLSTEVKSHLLVVLTPVFVIAAIKTCMIRHLLVVLTHELLVVRIVILPPALSLYVIIINIIPILF